MTLSKVICTSLRKSSFLLLLLFVLLANVSGTSFRVAIVSEDESYTSLVEDVLDVYATTLSSSYVSNQVNSRVRATNENSYYKSLNNYLKAENFSSLAKLSLETIDEEVTSLEIVRPTLTEVELKYLFNGDIEAFSYIKLRDSYDMLIAIAKISEDIIPELTLYIDGKNVRNCLYSEALRDSEETALFEIFTPLLLSEDYKLVDIDLPINGTLYIDDIEESMASSKLALEKGQHTISYIIPGYVTKSFEYVVNDTTEHIELSLEKLPPGRLSLSSVPYDADIFYNGFKLDSKNIESLVYPFTITATREGFSLYSMQSMLPMERLSIQLKPEWMSTEDIMEEAKSDFYMNLFASLMCFGSYVASQTISNLVPDYNLTPVSVVLGGISLVSLINMVDSMFEYFDSASYGI